MHHFHHSVFQTPDTDLYESCVTGQHITCQSVTDRNTHVDCACASVMTTCRRCQSQRIVCRILSSCQLCVALPLVPPASPVTERDLRGRLGQVEEVTAPLPPATHTHTHTHTIPSTPPWRQMTSNQPAGPRSLRRLLHAADYPLQCHLPVALEGPPTESAFPRSGEKRSCRKGAKTATMTNASPG